jgi:tetratricopeptide (TPR) repeat protein
VGDLTQTIDSLANPTATQRDVDALRADVERAVNLIKQQSPQAFNADTEAALRESIERLLTSQSGARGEAARSLESGDIDGAVAQLQSAADEGERAAEGLAQTWAEIGALRFGTDSYAAMEAYARAAQLAPANIEYRIMLGNLQIRVARLDDAYATFTAIVQEADTNSMSALAYGNLGVIAKMRADSSTARDHFEVALELNRADGNKSGEAADLGDLGDLALSEKRFTDAKKLYEQSLALYTEMNDPEGQVTTTIRLAMVARDRDRLDEAERLYASALSRAQMNHDQIGISGAQSGLGDVALARRQLASAKTSYEAGLAAAVSISAREDEAYALGGLGEVAEAQGDKVVAINHLREAMWIYNDIGNVAEAQLIMDKMKKLGALPHPDGPEN